MKILFICILIIGNAAVWAQVGDLDEAAMIERMQTGAGLSSGQGRPHKLYKKAAVKADLKYIRCGTCKAVVDRSMQLMKKLRDEETVSKKVTESDILDQLEAVCDPDTDAGEWLNYVDLKEERSKLTLHLMTMPSECQVECFTVVRSCTDLTEGMDLVELSQALWKNKEKEDILQMLCHTQTDACQKPSPSLPKDRPKGPDYVAIREGRPLELWKSMRSLSKVKGFPPQRRHLEEL